jgi:hypothetical protein
MQCHQVTSMLSVIAKPIVKNKHDCIQAQSNCCIVERDYEANHLDNISIIEYTSNKKPANCSSWLMCER